MSEERIVVVGLGYVGLSAAVLLSRRYSVEAVDILPERVEAVNARRCPLKDTLLSSYLQHEPLRLHATLDAEEAFRAASLVLIAVPTDYNPDTHGFDTHLVEETLLQVARCNPHATAVIRSTVPIGFSTAFRAKHPQQPLLFSPEFLRESHALYDNLHPSRIVVGTDLRSSTLTREAQRFASMMAECAENPAVPTQVIGYDEAEAVKLFANTYLAMRIAFFNELDTYAEQRGMDARQIIDGVCLDPRIGNHYNNPSFGYGGYCLPKDTRQLLTNYAGIPQRIICAVVESNQTRMDFIAQQVLQKARQAAGAGETARIGIYRLTMKTGSDNFRHSSIQGVMARLAAAENVTLVIYEPLLPEAQEAYQGYPILHDLTAFKETCHIIVANRMDSALADAADKVYSRDLFRRD